MPFLAQYAAGETLILHAEEGPVAGAIYGLTLRVTWGPLR